MCDNERATGSFCNVCFFVFVEPDTIVIKETVSPNHELINLNAIVALRNINHMYTVKKGPKISGEDNTTTHVFIYNVYTLRRKAVRNKMYGNQPKFDMPNRPVTVPGLIVIDGPIGAGKTTFIEHLRDELVQSGARVRVIDEAIPPELEEYYKDPSRNVYAFQKTFIFRLFDVWADLFRQGGTPFREHDFVICDRYWASTRAFVQYHYDKGNINDKQYWELVAINNLFISLCPLFPEYYIFIDEINQTCLERIAKRGRPGETSVGDRYMSEVNEYIRRYNNFPFFGEGDTNPLLELVDKKTATFACSRAILGRFAQQTKVIHLTGIKENTTRGTMLPEKKSVDIATELVQTIPLTRHTREFLMEEAVLVATTGKPSGVTVSLSSK